MRGWVGVLVLLGVVAGAQAAVGARVGEGGKLGAGHGGDGLSTVELGAGWRLQDAAKVAADGERISRAGFGVAQWYRAVVPGTVLTTLVKAKVYPEPLYGENNRPERIPESLNKTDWWYRAVVRVPAGYAGRRVWLNFEGINYSAEVWVNGERVGEMKGAFARGRFDVTEQVRSGGSAVVAVRVSPQPHPGVPHEHTWKAGMGKNGGVTAEDGPTLLSTIGWDWLPAIRDRDTGIWQRVFLSSTGDVRVEEPLVTTKFVTDAKGAADVAVSAKVWNVGQKSVSGVLKGSIEGVQFEKAVTVGAGETLAVAFNRETDKGLRLESPRVWWPNGYGGCAKESGRSGTPSGSHSSVGEAGGGVTPCLKEMYLLKLSFVEGAKVSDAVDVPFGVREIGYSLPGVDGLAISVNGVPVMVRGGDWGLDEGMKRVPRARLEAQIRMHALANLNMIRNWVGQSTSEAFYDLCDKYGILLWDEFFQPNPSDGPNPDDVATYLANAREKIVRFRNHPSIAVWCGRNEGAPPKEINDALQKWMDELEPVRRYQPSSTDGAGVRSGGPYRWRTPREFYAWKSGEVFKTEMGSVSIPTLESVHGMMPAKDWETINDDWAEHDFAKGASGSDTYKAVMESRYGKVANLADFVRKGQMMNYEAFRAMYEGRNARMFAAGSGASESATGVITWMSHPAQPSFVWQLYHYDLEPNAALFAVKSAAEPVHVQWNEATDVMEVVNNTPAVMEGAVRVQVLGLEGKVMSSRQVPVVAAASSTTELERVVLAQGISFVKLELVDAMGAVVSRNFYWRGAGAGRDDLRAMDAMPRVVLAAEVLRKDAAGKTTLSVVLRNPTEHVAVMAHLQVRRKNGERVLPVFYGENYVSLGPGESRSLAIAFDTAELKGGDAVMGVDGWNVGVEGFVGRGVSVRESVEDEVGSWPVTGLPVATEGLR